MYFRFKLQLFILLSAAFLLGNAVYSQNPYRLSAGARQVGLAYASVTLNGFWSSFHNQASFGSIENFSIGVNQDNRFGLAELSNKTFGIAIPSGKGALGIVYSYYGYTEYNRHTAGLAYGMQLSPKLSAGVQCDLYSTRAAMDYENTNSLTFEAGLLYSPNDKLRIGAHVFNPLPNSLRERELPSSMQFGLSYCFTSTFMALSEIEVSDLYPMNIKVAAEYEFYTSYFARAGVMNKPLGFSFGMGYSGRIFKVDIGFITHENLGLTPSLSLVVLI